MKWCSNTTNKLSTKYSCLLICWWWVAKMAYNGIELMFTKSHDFLPCQPCDMISSQVWPFIYRKILFGEKLQILICHVHERLSACVSYIRSHCWMVLFPIWIHPRKGGRHFTFLVHECRLQIISTHTVVNEHLYSKQKGLTHEGIFIKYEFDSIYNNCLSQKSRLARCHSHAPIERSQKCSRMQSRLHIVESCVIIMHELIVKDDNSCAAFYKQYEPQSIN